MFYCICILCSPLKAYTTPQMWWWNSQVKKCGQSNIKMLLPKSFCNNQWIIIQDSMQKKGLKHPHFITNHYWSRPQAIAIWASICRSGTAFLVQEQPSSTTCSRRQNSTNTFWVNPQYFQGHSGQDDPRHLSRPFTILTVLSYVVAVVTG